MKTNLFPKVFAWMFVGLIITFLTAYYVSINENMVSNIFSTNMYWIIFAVEIILVVVLSSRVTRMSFSTAALLFCLYSFISGLTFSIFFVMFKLSSIIFIFALAAIIFGLFSLFGFITKVDLSKFASLFFMGLLAIIIVSIVNIFIGSDLIEMIVSWVIIFLFVGITAFDIQKIKELELQGVEPNNLAIIGAFQLYLDFINIFVSLLRLFGNYKD